MAWIWGKGCTSAGGCVLGQGTETKRLPEGSGEKKDPLERQPRVSLRSQPAGSSP